MNTNNIKAYYLGSKPVRVAVGSNLLIPTVTITGNNNNK